MCDFIPGQLLICFLRKDVGAQRLFEIIEHELIENVKLADTMDNRLTRLMPDFDQGQTLDAGFTSGSRVYAKLTVPNGEEIWSISRLFSLYLDIWLDKAQDGISMPKSITRSPQDYLQITVNARLSLSASSIALSADHAKYRKNLGFNALPQPPYPSNRAIAILDSGLNNSAQYPLGKVLNLTDENQPHNVDDGIEHGTVVAKIIHDLCPNATLSIYKVADNKGNANEWDVLTALIVCREEVVNLSLQFGFSTHTCLVCGRQSGTSRSAVFQNRLVDMTNQNPAPVVVAAAGNAGVSKLAFPARFPETIAIESIDSAGDLSAFSNYDGHAHAMVFVAPGGQTVNGSITEHVAISGSGVKYVGTSFSAAYASAMVFAQWSAPSNRHLSAQNLLADMKTNADRQYPAYLASDHGNGMMQVS